MPLIATRASAAFGAGFSRVVTTPYLGPFGAYDSLATFTVPSGGLNSVTFQGIPQTYAHLQIRAIHRQDLANTGVDWINIRMGNNFLDTGSNYVYHYLLGDGAAASSSNGLSQSKILCSLGNPSNNQTALVFGSSIMDIYDYANPNKYTTVKIMNGLANNTSSENYVMFSSGLWLNTQPVTTISLFNNTGTNNFVQNSQFALYGVK